MHFRQALGPDLRGPARRQRILRYRRCAGGRRTIRRCRANTTLTYRRPRPTAVQQDYLIVAPVMAPPATIPSSGQSSSSQLDHASQLFAR